MQGMNIVLFHMEPDEAWFQCNSVQACVQITLHSSLLNEI